MKKKTNRIKTPVIDNSFVKLLPKLEMSKAEEVSYAQRLKKDGVVIFVCKRMNIILDGVIKFRLCKKYDIPYEIIYIDLATRIDAQRWILNNAFRRHNLSRWHRSCLAIKFWKKLYEKEAKNNMRLSKGRGKKGKKDTSKVFAKVDVGQRLADKAGVSRDTISKVMYILGNKNLAPKGLFVRLDKEEISINRAKDLVNGRKKVDSKDKKSTTKLNYINNLSKGVENNILCMDVQKGIAKIPNGTLSLCVTSPPFACNKKYADGIRDDTPHKKHWEWLKETFKALKPKFREGGRCIIEYQRTRTREKDDQAFEYNRPTDALIINMMQELGYLYHSTIIWDKGRVGNSRTAWGSFCSPSSPRIRDMHSSIFVFSVGEWKLPCASGDSSELTFEDFDLYTKSIWRIPPETHGYGSHVCPFPLELAKRAIRLFSYKNDLVCDIFGGSGTVAISALQNQRRYVHIDKSKTYCAETKQRIAIEMKKLETETSIKKAA